MLPLAAQPRSGFRSPLCSAVITGFEAYYHRTTRFNVSVGDIPVLLFADSGLDSRSRRHLGFGGRSRADGQRVHIQARQATAVMEIYAVHVFARRVRKKKKTPRRDFNVKILFQY